MIKGCANAKTRRVHETGAPKGFRRLDGEKAADRMDDLQAALSIDNLAPLKSLRLHKLKGNLKGFWAIDVNGPWRIIFKPTAAGFDAVEIVDYH